MKRPIISMVLTGFLISATITSCSSSAEKVENAEGKVDEANQELDEAKDAYLEDIEQFKAETAEKIAANEKSIQDFKSRVNSQKKEAKADYLKKIEELEAQNSDAKKKLDDYQAEGKEKWESFKITYNSEMEKIAAALIEISLVF